MAFHLKSLRETRPTPASVKEVGGEGMPGANSEWAAPKRAHSVHARELEPLASAGVGLTKWVLAIIATALALLIGMTFYQQQRYTDLFASNLRSMKGMHTGGAPHETRTESDDQKDVWKAYQDAVAASRDFWMKLDQMVLLNLLLPVLTALLGYVFGSKAASKT